MNYPETLAKLMTEVGPMDFHGKVAAYIPELARVDGSKFGICLVENSGSHHGVGDWQERFSIQSIAKVLSLALAYRLEGEELWSRVGVEPSGTAFNSLIQLETENGKPRNPFINAGAIVVCDVLASKLPNPLDTIQEMVRELSGVADIRSNARVAESERGTGNRNAALIHLMKSFGNIHNRVETVLDLYFALCAIEMNCEELARTFQFLARGGVNPYSGDQVLTSSQAKRINAIMLLCGFYDEAGEFAFRVGLPGKSGVGGGIVAVQPGAYSVAVWGPRLNPRGNSAKGMKALELLTTYTGTSIF